MQTQGTDIPGVIAYPPLIFAACLGLGLGLHWLKPIPLSPPAPLRVVGIVLLVASATLSLWASAVMRRAETNIRPDRPATTVVTAGPFRFTRNPLYLSLCLLNAGIALVLSGLIPLLMTVVLVTILQRGVIVREERYLKAKFGAVYSDYSCRVRRWL